MNHTQAINYFIAHDHLTSDISSEERSRLLNSLEILQFDVDQEIFAVNQEAGYLYYLVEGTVQVLQSAEDEEGLSVKQGEYFGHEAGSMASHYIKTAIARDRVTVVRIPAEHINVIFFNNRNSARRFILDMFAHFTPMNITENFLFKNLKIEKPASLLNILGWIVTLASPFLVYFLLANTGFPEPARLFCSILGMALCMWVFDFFPNYVPGIFLLAALMTTGIAPTTITLSGFSSETFIMTLSTYALGSVMASSGIMYRSLLWILKYIPATQAWANLSLFMMGIALSFTVPMTANRVKIIAPYLKDMTEFSHVKPGTLEITRMCISSFMGTSLFSSIFLSASLHNFILLGLLWAQDQERFQWGGWLQASAITGGIIFICYILGITVICKNAPPIQIDRQRITQQYKLLGVLTSKEKVAILSFLFFTIGVTTSSIHRMPPSALSLLVLLVILSFHALDKDSFQKSIDWPSLLLLAGLIGVVSVFNHLNLNSFIVSNLSWLGHYIKTDFPLFVLILTGIMCVIRLFVPYAPATIIVASILIPLAQEYEANAWLTCFISLVIGKMWFFPYQYPPYGEMKELIGGTLMFNQKRFLIANLLVNFIKIIALLLSIPYWVNFGLI